MMVSSTYPKLKVPGSGFKGYNRWILPTKLIKIRHTRHTPSSETGLQPDKDTIQLKQAAWDFSTRNVEP